MILWQRSLPRITTVLVVVIVLGGCAVSEQRAGPGADGTPAVAVACAQDTPDCEDTELVEDGLDDAASGIETTPPTPTVTATEPETRTDLPLTSSISSLRAMSVIRSAPPRSSYAAWTR